MKILESIVSLRKRVVSRLFVILSQSSKSSFWCSIRKADGFSNSCGQYCDVSHPPCNWASSHVSAPCQVLVKRLSRDSTRDMLHSATIGVQITQKCRIYSRTDTNKRFCRCSNCSAKKMDRKELLQLMPRNASDTEAARFVVGLGYPAVAPIHRDMIQMMRVAESPVADIFADYFAKIGGPSAPAVAEGLNRENCWLRHRIFTRVLPSWSDLDLSSLRNILTMVATHPDAYDNDVRCVCLLAERGLADLDWLAQWLAFKRERMAESDKLVNRAATIIKQVQQGAAGQPATQPRIVD